MPRFSIAALLVALLLLLRAPVADCTPIPKAIQALNVAAQKDFDAGNFEQAAVKFLEIYQQDPSQPTALYNAARGFHLGNNLERAEQSYRQYLALGATPKDKLPKIEGYLRDLQQKCAELKATQARAAEQSAKFAVALELWLEAEHLAPERPTYLARAGRAAQLAEQNDKALALYKQYLAKAPMDAPDRNDVARWHAELARGVALKPQNSTPTETASAAVAAPIAAPASAKPTPALHAPVAAKVLAVTPITTAPAKVAPSGMVLIPAGSFLMGCVAADGSCDRDKSPQHSVTLDAFFFDIFEVTEAKYKACVDAGFCSAPSTTHVFCSGTMGKDNNWDGGTGRPKVGREQHPVNCVNWTQADAYCRWTDAKGHLPTEAQWEKAARGGLEDRKFPWGDADPTCRPGQPNSAVWSDGGKGCGRNGTWAVGTGSSKNGFGLYDMAGNVWEWVGDWHAPGYYADAPEMNPTGPAGGSARVTRGSSFANDVAGSLRASVRGGGAPALPLGSVGFRCAR